MKQMMSAEQLTVSWNCRGGKVGGREVGKGQQEEGMRMVSAEQLTVSWDCEEEEEGQGQQEEEAGTATWRAGARSMNASIPPPTDLRPLVCSPPPATPRTHLQELADIVEHRSAPEHRLDDGGEVVVEDDDVGGLLGHLGTCRERRGGSERTVSLGADESNLVNILRPHAPPQV